MPIVYNHGNILDTRSDALVNPVNTHGVMGAGLALHVKRLYPSVFKAYNSLCVEGGFGIGDLHALRVPFMARNMQTLGQTLFEGTTSLIWIINLPTKTDWRLPSEMEYVSIGLNKLSEFVHTKNIESVAIPALGCGLGGLSWPDVHKRIIDTFKDIDVLIEIYPPH